MHALISLPEEWRSKNNAGFIFIVESPISTDYDEHNSPGLSPVLRVAPAATLKGKDSLVKSIIEDIIKSVDTQASVWILDDELDIHLRGAKGFACDHHVWGTPSTIACDGNRVIHRPFQERQRLQTEDTKANSCRDSCRASSGLPKANCKSGRYSPFHNRRIETIMCTPSTWT